MTVFRSLFFVVIFKRESISEEIEGQPRLSSVLGIRKDNVDMYVLKPSLQDP